MCTGGGAWRRWLVIYPDHFTSKCYRQNICAVGGGVAAAVTNTHAQAHQWAANYFLVRMVVPWTKLVENPCSRKTSLPVYKYNYVPLGKFVFG